MTNSVSSAFAQLLNKADSAQSHPFKGANSLAAINAGRSDAFVGRLLTALTVIIIKRRSVAERLLDEQ
jgi:hypothetical protein